MDFSKDYYKTLGILPSAEDALVRAAYRALSQIYHPDKNASPDAAEKMREINEAYSVLSNPLKRPDYDAARKTSTDSPAQNDFEPDPEPNQNPIDSDWRTATRFYPDLDSICAKLKKISWRVENSYKAYLLDSKHYEKRHEISNNFEREFLQRYFGKDPYLVKFAKQLILSGNKSAARDLNNAIRVLGQRSDPSRIISIIKKDHNVDHLTRLDEALNKIKRGDYCDEYVYQKIIENFGGTMKYRGFLSGKYDITYQGKSYVILSFNEIRPWILEHLFSNQST